MTVDAYCDLIYGSTWKESKKSKKSKQNTVSKMCREGSLDAEKSGRRWLIRMEEK